MVFYGLTDARLAGSDLGAVVELFVSREEADEALRDVLADEPEWVHDLAVVPVEFYGGALS